MELRLRNRGWQNGFYAARDRVRVKMGLAVSGGVDDLNGRRLRNARRLPAHPHFAMNITLICARYSKRSLANAYWRLFSEIQQIKILWKLMYYIFIHKPKINGKDQLYNLSNIQNANVVCLRKNYNLFILIIIRYLPKLPYP